MKNMKCDKTSNKKIFCRFIGAYCKTFYKYPKSMDPHNLHNAWTVNRKIVFITNWKLSCQTKCKMKIYGLSWKKMQTEWRIDTETNRTRRDIQFSFHIVLVFILLQNIQMRWTSLRIEMHGLMQSRGFLSVKCFTCLPFHT